MSNVLIVLFSSNDSSRDFVKQVPPDVTVIDWADESQHTKYQGPSPSSFPVVCMTVVASGVPSDTLVGMFTPTDWKSVTIAAAGVDKGFGADNQKTLSSISLFGAFTAGQPIQGPLVDLFADVVFLKSNVLNPDAKVQVPLLLLLFRSYAETKPEIIQAYWQNLTAKPPAWLDQPAIDFLVSVSQLYKIPLLPTGVSK